MVFVRKLFAILAFLGLGVAPAASNEQPLLDGTRKTLNDEVLSTILSPDFVDQFVSGEMPDTIMDDLFDQATAALHDDHKRRIRVVFAEYVIKDCGISANLLTLSEDEQEAIARGQEAKPLKQVIANMQMALGFDPGLPGWGLVDLPEFNLSALKCGSMLDEITALRDYLKNASEKDPASSAYPRRYNPHVPENDAFSHAIAEYKAGFQTSDLEDAVRIDALGRQLALQCFEAVNQSRTILDLLDEEAELLGLTKS